MRFGTRVIIGLAGVALSASLASAQPVIVTVVPPASAVRVGPGTASPARAEVRTGAPVRGRRGGTVLVAPARSTFDARTAPPGYRAAWDDGRHNALRGPRTLEGDYQSDGVWTGDTPRRLQPVIRVTR